MTDQGATIPSHSSGLPPPEEENLRELSVLDPLRRMRTRLTLAREDSDTAYFLNLMYGGELVIKLVASGLLACLETDRDRQRYRLEHGLVRANGLGEWVRAIEDIVVGPPSQLLHKEARIEQRELTQRVSVDDSSWIGKSILLLRSACLALDSSYGGVPLKAPLRTWFQDFVWLRNKTRGHGAITGSQCRDLAVSIEESLALIERHFTLFRRTWVYLHRNLSGKYRVIGMAGDPSSLDYLKRDSSHSYFNGVHLDIAGPRHARLVTTDVDLTDYYVPNGNFLDASYEALSYISGATTRTNGSDFLAAPTELPESGTRGQGTLEPMGQAFTNLPEFPSGYVARNELESELKQVLQDDRHPVVTLVGRGGIGKTSTALKVAYDIALTERFTAIVWFSARDIDLLPEGPKIVRPGVLTETDIAEEFVDLLAPSEAISDDFVEEAYLASQLGAPGPNPVLFIFDNFETVKSPVDLFYWLDTYIRLPNKILITTRGREFKGDYHVEVRGMTEEEFLELVKITADRLGIAKLLTKDYLQELYKESGGHPYIVKVLLGEVADAGRVVRVSRIMAGRDDILDALFDRTFVKLSPVAKRVFLTLSNWQSVVPKVVLEAALLRPQNEFMDVQDGLDQLERSSLIEVNVSPDGQEFISLPLAASLFAKRKLSVSPYQTSVIADSELMRLIGAMGTAEISRGLAPRMERLFHNVAELLEASSKTLPDVLPVLEYVARSFPPAWLWLADLFLAHSPPSTAIAQAIDATGRYLEERPNDGTAWKRLATLLARSGDRIGEIALLIQRAKQPSCSYPEISHAANRLNSLLVEGSVTLPPEERRAFIHDLLVLMEERVTEANATDCSRVAWLYRNLGDSPKALYYAMKGLDMDATNEHCRRIVETSQSL